MGRVQQSFVPIGLTPSSHSQIREQGLYFSRFNGPRFTIFGHGGFLVKEAVKSIVRALSPIILRHKPIQQWPASMGRLHGVKVPAAIATQPAPAPTGAANINILCEMLERTWSISGAIADCGVYRGGSTVAMALYLRQRGLERPIYAFDSFEGFPADALEQDLLLGGEENEDRVQGGFSKTSLEEIQRKITRFKLNKITLVKGFFSDTFPVFPKDIKFSFVHLDVNLEASYRDCLEEFYPRLTAGGIVLLDEYNDPPWPGCNKAVDEFLSTRSENLEAIERNNYIKYYFVKQ